MENIHAFSLRSDRVAAFLLGEKMSPITGMAARKLASGRAIYLREPHVVRDLSSLTKKSCT